MFEVRTKTTSHGSGGVGPRCIPVRYVVIFMSFVGITLQYSMKVLLSVAIVAMVKSDPTNTTESQHFESDSDEVQDVCPRGETTANSANQDGDFDWSSDLQGYTLSAYFYGYIATQLLGGRLSDIYGPKFVLGPGVFLAGLMTVLGPLAARMHVGIFIAVRVLVGAASGLVIPSTHILLIKWTVPKELLFVGGIVMIGSPLGTVISMILSGILADIGGWPLIFYFFGGLSIAFILPWIFLAYDDPDKHPRISEAEKNYVLSNIESKDKESYPVPWLAILTSWPMWVHVVMGVGNTWVTYTLMSDMPTYLNKVLHYNVKDSGIISALPYIALTITYFVGSYVSKCLRHKNWFLQLTVYKIFNSISSYGSSLCLFLITISGCNSTVIIIILVCAVGLLGFYQGGSFISHVDLGKNFTGTLAGIQLTVLNCMGIFAPSVTGIIISGTQTLGKWNIVFYIGASLPIICCTLYTLFGSMEEQYWNRLPSKTEKNSEESKMNLHDV